jgi:hypothetical protein
VPYHQARWIVMRLHRDQERPQLPRTARLARYGVAAHGALRPTSDGNFQRAGRTGSTQDQPWAASFDRITLSNQGSQGERAPSRRSAWPVALSPLAVEVCRSGQSGAGGSPGWGSGFRRGRFCSTAGE